MYSTSDVKQRYLPDWMILGDNSRSIFLNWLLSGLNLRTDENSEIWVRYGVRLQITQQETQWVIETPMLLPRTTLCFPAERPFDSTLETSRRTKYAVLEEFPFRKQANINLLQRLEGSGNETLVILMDLSRHQGSTDLIPPGEDLKQAIEAYQAERHYVSVMQSVKNVHSVLHWHRPMYDVWANKIRNYLADIRDCISEIPYDYPFFKEDWEDVGGPLQDETMDQLFSYQTSKREKGTTLWDRYAAASKKALFPASGQGPLTSVADHYKKCMNNPLTFWPLDEDVKSFMDELQKAFLKAIDKEEAKGHYRKKTQISGQLDEDSYFRLAARSGGSGIALNAIFSKIIRNYLCDEVKNHLQKRLEQRYQQLEGMIP